MTRTKSGPRKRHSLLQRSPITKIPRDVLIEIFTHCLPLRPLAIQRADMSVAPMLLCHICSRWRRIALACPTLWSHLSYCLTVRRIPEELGGWAFLQNEIEYIMFWKKNQGSIAPFLCFDLIKDYTYANDRNRLLVGDGLTFVLKYLSSAQYLQLSEKIWELVDEKLRDGYPFICAKLHTISTTNQWAYDGGSGIGEVFYRAQNHISRLPNQPPSALRRLSIHKNDLPFGVKVVPNHWSTLTHLSLNNVGIFLSFWFPLVRAVPNLQWAFIYFNEIVDMVDTLSPAEHVLPYLSTLFIGMPWGEKRHFRPGLLFTRLRLPALQTLSFSCLQLDHEHIPEIYTLLQSTPALTTLTLKGYDTLAKGTYRLTPQAAARGRLPPLWGRTPQLMHLQLALPSTMGCSRADTAALLDGFVRHAFFGATSLWAIDDPRCPVRTVTLIDMESATPLRFSEIENLTRARIQLCGGSNIIFKFVTKVDDASFEEPEAPIWQFSSVWDLE